MLPSAERDTDQPCQAFPTAPEPTSLFPCWVQTRPFLVQTHVAPPAIEAWPSDNGRVAVSGEGHETALHSAPHGARADQLGSLLGPDASAPRPDPHGTSATIVVGPSDDGRVAVGGEEHGPALICVPHGARADQLGSLLGPDASAPRSDPHGTSATVVAEPSDDGRVAVAGDGHGISLSSAPHGVGPH